MESSASDAVDEAAIRTIALLEQLQAPLSTAFSSISTNPGRIDGAIVPTLYPLPVTAHAQDHECGPIIHFVRESETLYFTSSCETVYRLHGGELQEVPCVDMHSYTFCTMQLILPPLMTSAVQLHPSLCVVILVLIAAY